MNAVRKEKVQVIASEPDPVLGYRKYTFGSFTFERDAYFVHVRWPKGMHTIEVDRFLRAADPRVQQVTVSLSGGIDTVLVARSDGVLASDVRPLVRLNVQVIVEQNGRRESGYAGMGGRYGYAELFADGNNLTDQVARVHTSFLKDDVELPGRSFDLGVRVFF